MERPCALLQCFQVGEEAGPFMDCFSASSANCGDLYAELEELLRRGRAKARSERVQEDVRNFDCDDNRRRGGTLPPPPTAAREEREERTAINVTFEDESFRLPRWKQTRKQQDGHDSSDDDVGDDDDGQECADVDSSILDIENPGGIGVEAIYPPPLYQAPRRRCCRQDERRPAAREEGSSRDQVLLDSLRRQLFISCG